MILTLHAAGIAIEGTVYAGIRIGDDGSVEPLELYGAPLVDARVEHILRDAIRKLRYRVPDGWAAANPRREWSMFFMFRTGDCRTRVYLPPRQSTPILVCTPVRDGRIEIGQAYEQTWAAGSTGPARRSQPEIVSQQPMPYPASARARGVEGGALLRAWLDDTGRVARVDWLHEVESKYFRERIRGWLGSLRFETPDTWSAPGEPRAVTVLVTFRLAVDGKCPDTPTATPSNGIVVTVCGSAPIPPRR